MLKISVAKVHDIHEGNTSHTIKHKNGRMVHPLLLGNEKKRHTSTMYSTDTAVGLFILHLLTQGHTSHFSKLSIVHRAANIINPLTRNI